MTPTERRTASQNLLARSDDEFNNGGDTMIAAELLWGSAAPSRRDGATAAETDQQPLLLRAHGNRAGSTGPVKTVAIRIRRGGPVAPPFLPPEPQDERAGQPSSSGKTPRRQRRRLHAG